MSLLSISAEVKIEPSLAVTGILSTLSLAEKLSVPWGSQGGGAPAPPHRQSPFHILWQIAVSDRWLPYFFQEMVPWMIFFTRSWSLFWCFHSFRSWKVCSCELCLRFILSTLSVFTFVPGKLSTRTLSQFGVNLVGTANLKKASSHRVTSAGMWKTTGFTEHFNFPVLPTK